MTESLKRIARGFKRELRVYRAVLADPRTPRLSRILLGLAVAYVAMPFDLIPDFIPVLGQLDDLVIVPALVYFALRSLPAGMLEEHRRRS